MSVLLLPFHLEYVHLRMEQRVLRPLAQHNLSPFSLSNYCFSFVPTNTTKTAAYAAVAASSVST